MEGQTSISRFPFRRLSGLIPPGILGNYILGVGAAGALLTIYALAHLPAGQLDLLVTFFILCFLLEWAPIRLLGTPLQGSSLSVSAAGAFAALLLLGPAGSIIANLGSALAYGLKEKRPFYKRLLTSGALVTSSGLAAGVYWLAGGGLPITFDMPQLGAAGLGAAVYFITNACLISGAISLATRRPFRSVLSNWQWLFLQMLTSLAIGLIMALAGSYGMGSPGFLFAGLLLVLPWYSTQVYVQKSHQVAEQTEQLKKANAELERANRSLDRQNQSLRALHNIGITLNSAQSLQEIFTEILNSVQRLIGADASAIFLYDQNRLELNIVGQVGLSAEYLEKPELALDGSARRALNENRVLVMDTDNHVPEMLSIAAVRDSIQCAACLPLNVTGEVVGGLDVAFRSQHTFGKDEVDLLSTLAEQAAVAIQNARLVEQIHESYLSTIRVLAATVEAKDPYTRGHSEVVRQLAIATGRRLGLAAAQLEMLNIAALFHDIGKIGIPESILNKPDQLNEDEWRVMRQHPTIGEEILSKVPALADVPRIVRHHHERFDGRGYPDGIAAREDLLAAVISVCDSYQAMTSNRTYRKAYSHATAVDEVRRASGTQFVPEVVDAFLSALDYHDARHAKIYHFNPYLLLRTKPAREAAEAV